jgi:hypothetical protein
MAAQDHQTQPFRSASWSLCERITLEGPVENEQVAKEHCWNNGYSIILFGPCRSNKKEFRIIAERELAEAQGDSPDVMLAKSGSGPTAQFQVSVNSSQL